MPAPETAREANLAASLFAELSHKVAQLPAEQRVSIQEDLQKTQSAVERLVQAAPDHRGSEFGQYTGQFFNLLSEAALVYEVIRDETGRVVDWVFREVNAAALQLLGLDRAAIAGTTASELYGASSIKLALPEISEVLRTGEICEREEQFGSRSFRISLFKIDENVVGRMATEITALRQAERDLLAANNALIASETGYRDLAESIQDGFFELDRDWCITFINQRAASTTGHTPADLVGKNFWEVYPAVQDTQSEWVYRRVMATRQPENFEISGVYSKRWYSVRVYPTTRGIAIFWIDINERKHAEEEIRRSEAHLRSAAHSLRESEARFRTMADGTPVLIWVTDPQGRIEFINRAYSEFFGVTLEEIRAGSWQMLIHPDDTPGYIDSFKRANQAQRSFRALGHVRRADGQWRWIDSHGQPRLSPTGDYLGMAGSSLDVTDRMQAEAALELERAKLAAVIQHLPIGLGIADTQGNTLSMNAAGLALHGFQSETEMYARLESYIRDFELCSLDGMPLPLEQWPASKAMRGEFVSEYEVILKNRPAGTQCYVSYSCVPVKGAAEETVLLLYVMQDVTGRYRFEQAVRASEARERARAAELEALMDAVPAIIWISRDPECREMYGNRYSYDFLKIPPGENVSKTAPPQVLHTQRHHMEKDGRLIPPAELPIQVSAASGMPVRDYTTDIVCDDDGQRFNLYGNVNPLLDAQGKPYGAIGVFIDITNLRQLEAGQIAAKTEIEVQRRLMDQREQERQSIARDLHDGPIQTLASSIFHLHMIKETFTEPALQVELNTITMNIKTTIHELREVLNDLRPPILMHFGFSRVLQLYTQDLQDRFPEIAFVLDVADGNQNLSETARLALFRIFQAGTNNIVRHSGASKTWVTYSAQDGAFYLELRDNGRGFEPFNDFAYLTRDGHFGLVGMKERAEAIGAQLSVSSTPGEGTKITVTGPVRQDD